MSDLVWGIIIGALGAGVIRFSVGRFIIYTSERGWVFRFSRFDEEDQRIMDRVSRALETGNLNGWCFAYREWQKTGVVPCPYGKEQGQ